MAADGTGADPSRRVAEFTVKAVACGLLFGALFGAANAYIGLKAGLTVSTSIPIAVLSVAAFRLFGGGTILEANLAQTVGSASSSLAAGTIFTIPALFMWGIAPGFVQVGLLAMLGGLLGILAMIPLRRLLIVQADAELPYPEGRACAEVLKNCERGATGGRWIFLGLGVGALLKLAISGRPLFVRDGASAHPFIPEDLELALPFLPNGTLALSVDAVLLAVGFILGYRSAAVMVAGGLLSGLVLYPLVTKMHGVGIVEMGGVLSEHQLDAGGAKVFVRYLGVGAVAVAGLLSVVKTAPTMFRSFAAVARGLRGSGGGGGRDRADRDLSSRVIVVGLVALALVIAFAPGLIGGDLAVGTRVLAAVAVIVFGFLFVPVSSRLVGLIGVTSNPTSAMALITLAVTAAFFVLLGRTEEMATKAAVLTVGTIVCVAASKAGDISQDLKTGFLVKGTPALQQFGQLIAASVACWVVAAVVMAIGNDPNSGFTGPNAMPAPQANMMKTVIEAVVGGSLPWDLVLMGGGVTAVAALVGLAPLQVALGIYLPLSTMATVFVGGCVRRFVDARAQGDARATESGILCASGLVAGVGLASAALSAIAFLSDARRVKLPAATAAEEIAGLVLLAVASALLVRAGRRNAP